MNKRGISAVVATVLIILITIAAVAIIWTLLLPTIKTNLGTADLNADLTISTSGGYTVWDSATNTSCVQIKRGSDSVNVTGMSIIFSFSDGNSQSKILNNSMVPSANQAKTFCFNMTGVGKPVSVSVAPIYYNENGQQITGAPTSSERLSPGSVSANTPVSSDFQTQPSVGCTPNCAGKQCGSNGCGGSCGSCTGNATCNATGQCVVACISQCPLASSIICGQQITPTNGCGTCSGTGSLCSNGDVCTGGQCVASAIQLFDCQILQNVQNKTYILMNDTSRKNPAQSDCFSITYCTNLTLNLNGYTIAGTVNSGYGVNIRSSNNIKVTNGNVRNFAFGVWLQDVQNSEISSLNVSGGHGEGIHLLSASSVISHNNVSSSSGYGISLDSSSAVVSANVACGNSLGDVKCTSGSRVSGSGNFFNNVVTSCYNWPNVSTDYTHC